MKRHGWIAFLLIVIVHLMVLYTIAFKVNTNEAVIVRTLGADRPIYGATDAGLHWKWPYPIQRIIRYDTRVLMFEDTSEQVNTSDQQFLFVTVFCGWRIADAEKFVRSIETVAKAELSIRSMVRDVKAKVIRKYPMENFVNADPSKVRLGLIVDEIFQSVRSQAAAEYGVEIATLGIKSLGLPENVTKTVIENMQEERKRKAESFNGMGEAVAMAILSQAETARDQILEFARARAGTIRAEGDLAAAEHYKKFKGNERFAMFLRELEFLRETLKENAVFLLDPSVQHSIGFFKDGPSLPPLNGDETASPSDSNSK